VPTHSALKLEKLFSDPVGGVEQHRDVEQHRGVEQHRDAKHESRPFHILARMQPEALEQPGLYIFPTADTEAPRPYDLVRSRFVDRYA
jgi:hypothetical protein